MIYSFIMFHKKYLQITHRTKFISIKFNDDGIHTYMYMYMCMHKPFESLNNFKLGSKEHKHTVQCSSRKYSNICKYANICKYLQIFTKS